jgi:hypothetical protein
LPHLLLGERLFEELRETLGLWNGSGVQVVSWTHAGEREREARSLYRDP